MGDLPAVDGPIHRLAFGRIVGDQNQLAFGHMLADAVERPAGHVALPDLGAECLAPAFGQRLLSLDRDDEIQQEL